jgi:hypothetical protein
METGFKLSNDDINFGLIRPKRQKLDCASKFGVKKAKQQTGLLMQKTF